MPRQHSAGAVEGGVLCSCPLALLDADKHENNFDLDLHNNSDVWQPISHLQPLQRC